MLMWFVTGLKSVKQNSAAESILPGDRVLVGGRRAGTVHFVGNTEFAPGVYDRQCRSEILVGVTIWSVILTIKRSRV